MHGINVFIVLLTRIFLRPLPSCLISVHQGDQRWKKCVEWGSGPLWGAGDQKEAWRESRLEPDFHDPPEVVSAQRRRAWPPRLPGQWNGLYSSDVAASLLNDMKAFLLCGPEVPSMMRMILCQMFILDTTAFNSLLTATDAASTNADPDLIVFHLASAGSHVPKKTWNRILLFATLSCLRVSGSGTSVKYREVILQM